MGTPSFGGAPTYVWSGSLQLGPYIWLHLSGGVKVNETEHNVDLDSDGTATTTAKENLLIVPQGTTHAHVLAGVPAGSLSFDIVDRNIMLAHPGTETASQLLSIYSNGSLYINKETASRCWAVEIN